MTLKSVDETKNPYEALKEIIIENDKLKEVNMEDDCVICLFIPYNNFFDVVPTHEIKKIKDC